MLTRLILVLLIIVAVGAPFAAPHLSFLNVDEPERVVEKPPFEQTDGEGVLVVGTQSFEPFDYQSTIDVTAATQASKTRQIRSDLAGEIERLAIERGDVVRPGDVIAQIAAETRTSQIAQAQANLEQARVDLAATTALVDQGVVAENRLVSAQAAYQAALAAVDQATDQINNLDVVSAIGGIVTEVGTEEGSNIAPGEPVATIIALDPIKILARVSETEIANVRKNQQVDVALVTGETFTATVTYIAPSANIATRTFDIEAEASNADFAIRDGVTATVKISRPVQQAFEINQSTLVTDEQGLLGVRVVNDSSMSEFVPVELLETSLESAWVTGLTADMRVMVVGQRFADVGEPVVAKDISEIVDASTAVDSVLEN